MKSAVVFVGANISALELQSHEALKVMDLADLETFIKARVDYAVNPGALTSEQIEKTLDVLEKRDKSADPETIARHAGSMHVPLRRKRTAQSGDVRAPERGVRPQSWTQPAHARTPTPTLRMRSPVEGLAYRFLSFVIRLALVTVFLAGMWWLVISGRVDDLIHRLEFANSAVETSNPVQQTVPADVSADGASSVSLATAKQALRDAAPDIYSQVSNLNDPEVTTSGGLATYKWEYVQVGGSKAVVKTIALTLDSDGAVVGVDM